MDSIRYASKIEKKTILIVPTWLICIEDPSIVWIMGIWVTIILVKNCEDSKDMWLKQVKLIIQKDLPRVMDKEHKEGELMWGKTWLTIA